MFLSINPEHGLGGLSPKEICKINAASALECANIRMANVMRQQGILAQVVEAHAQSIYAENSRLSLHIKPSRIAINEITSDAELFTNQIQCSLNCTETISDSI